MYAEPLGDVSGVEFRRAAERLLDLAEGYLGSGERSEPILSQVQPGELKARLGLEPPEHPISPREALQRFEDQLWEGLTHWNSPRFFAYFSISASMPGVLAEWLSAVLNQQAMLWRTSPLSTELEEVTAGWVRQALGLPEVFRGVIYDTASVSTLHALAAAREQAAPEIRAMGQTGYRLTVYCSEHTHSSIDKAVLLLGIGAQQLRKIPCDEELRLRPELLEEAILADRKAGFLPIAVVATAGTTSTATIDPLEAVADVCARQGVWLHVDAAYGGAAAFVPECRDRFVGWERADSIVFNPHKWLFTPFDCSLLFCAKMDVLIQAFSLTPEYLSNKEAGSVLNLMDTGVQLGRRFRSLKLWMLFHCFGREGLKERVRYHLECAREFGRWIESSQMFELALPVQLSLICFRWKGRSDADQLDLMERLNSQGRFYISHTKLGQGIVLRCAIGHLRTRMSDLRELYEELESLSVSGQDSER